MTRNSQRALLAVAVGVLVFIGVGASASFYFREHANPGFREFPTITGLHVILGGVFLALAPFQFVKRIRTRWPVLHRWAGRLLVATGLIAGVSGLFMAWIIPFAGWGERIVVGTLGILFCLGLGKGFLHVRAGQTALHREWMIRAFAIGLAIATMRLIFIPALIVALVLMGDPTDAQIDQAAVPLSIVSNLLAIAVNAAAAEVWIRATRRRAARPVRSDAYSFVDHPAPVR